MGTDRGELKISCNTTQFENPYYEEKGEAEKYRDTSNPNISIHIAKKTELKTTKNKERKEVE